MNRILCISLLFTSLLTYAQSPVKRTIPEDYTFFDVDANQLLYPGDSLAMERFFDKLDTLLFTGKGNVNIMHIGGSHVQAGVFSQAMRDNLLNLFPGLTAGRGLVFPFMKTNTPSSYSVYRTGEWMYFRNAVPYETRLGLAGASVTTSDPEASFSIVVREKRQTELSPHFDFNFVKILGYGDNDSIVPVVHFNDDTIHGTYNVARINYTN